MFLPQQFVEQILKHRCMLKDMSEWVCVCGYFKYNLHSTNKSPDSPSANPRPHLAIVHDNRRLRMAFHFNCVKLFWKSVSLFIWSTSPFCLSGVLFLFLFISGCFSYHFPFLLTIRLAQGHIYLNGSLLMSIFIGRFIRTNCLDKWDRENQFTDTYEVYIFHKY